MKYAYYPGCSLHSTGVEYDSSSRLVAKRMGIEFKEIPDWNCCGASAGHTTNHILGLALPARNLAIAEKEGLDVVAPCAACYNRMKTTELAVKASEETKTKIAELTEMPYNGDIGVKSALEVFVRDAGLDSVKALATKTLGGMKIAAYYGCLLVRPKGVGIDDMENPMIMDDLVTALGGEAVQWPYKTECCGAGLPTAKPQVGLKLVHDILDMAKSVGAEAIVTACPLCFVNLDLRQKNVNKSVKDAKFKIPVFYFTELMAMAFGEKPATVGAGRHTISTAEVLAKYNLK